MTDSSDIDPEARDAYLEDVTRLIKQYGNAVQHVLGDESGLSFSYTVGLAGLDRPEFVLVGLPGQVSQPILNDLAQRVRDGDAFEHGQLLHDVVQNYPVALIEVPDARDRLSVANALYGNGSPLPAFQVVFPDAESRWPWQEASKMAAMDILGPIPDALR